MIISNKSPMPEQGRTAWLNTFAYDVRHLLVAKFEAGQKEHGGDIGEVSTSTLVDNGIQEALDQLCYLGELKRRITLSPEHVMISRRSAKELRMLVEKLAMQITISAPLSDAHQELVKQLDNYESTTTKS